MALVKAKVVADDNPVTYDNPIAAKIQQRRYQILVHSLLYYDLDVTIVSDAKWAEWALELVSLQNSHPDIASRVIFADAFEGFDGSTGFNLPYHDEQVINIAYRLLSARHSAETADAMRRFDGGILCTPSAYEQYKTKSHGAKPTAVTKKEVKPVEQKQRKGLFSVPRK